jgi:hypothetical protein
MAMPLAWVLAGCAVEASASLHVEATTDESAAGSEAFRAMLVRPPQLGAGVQWGEPSTPVPNDCEGGDCDLAEALRITLWWSTGADLNLHVTDPMGETVDHLRIRSGSGGHLDRSSRGKCDLASYKPIQVERARWSVEPRRGVYSVDVHYWGECNSGAGATPVEISIQVGDEVHRLVHTLLPNERATLATCELR